MEEIQGGAALQKSKLFLDVLQQLQKPLNEALVDQAELVMSAFCSKCLPVMKHIVGKADESKLDPILGKAASYRATKFEVAQAIAVAEAVNRVVQPKAKNAEGVKVEDVRLAAHTVGNQFAFDFVSGDCRNVWFGISSRS